MHRRVTKRDRQVSSNRQQAGKASEVAKPAAIETLEPRLLLSASMTDPIVNQEDCAEYLENVGLTGLDQYGINITLDAPTDQEVSASGTEQVAALGEAGTRVRSMGLMPAARSATLRSAAAVPPNACWV